MRILHVCEVHSGGTAVLVEHFVNQQVRVGHEVHLLAPSALSADQGCVRHAWSPRRRRPWSLLTAASDLARTARRVRPDVVHLHSFVPGFLGRLPGALPRSLPVVYQPHAWAVDRFADPVRSGLIRSWERRASRRTSVLVANCADELAQGAAWGIRGPSMAIGVPIDLEYFRPPTAGERASARATLGRDGRSTLLVLGRLSRQKGQDQLLAAWEQEPLQDTDLMLVGEGEPGRLATLAPEQWGRSVHAVGSTDDVRTWIWASDVLVLPSRYETVSLVIGEALACAVPVVATQCNGVVEALVDGPLSPGGAVVAPGDMQSLLSEAAVRLRDQDLARREGLQGRNRAAALFDPHLVTDRLGTAYVQSGAGSIGSERVR